MQLNSDNDNNHIWVIASSALFFVPAIISFFRQSLLVSIVFLSSAVFSTLYHASNENNYDQLDVMWANLAIMVALILLALIACHYPPWNWRVLIPLVFGIVALVIYFTEGQATQIAGKSTNHYDLYHSLWHLFIAISGGFLVWTPVDIGEANMSYSEVFMKIGKNFRKVKVNETSMFR